MKQPKQIKFAWEFKEEVDSRIYVKIYYFVYSLSDIIIYIENMK